MADKPTFGIIVGTRDCFNADLARNGRQDLLARLEHLGYGAVILPADATASGAVEGTDDAEKCAKLFREHADEIDGILVSLPNFSNEKGIVNTIRLAKLDVPVMVQACDDDPRKVDTAHRRDAFCGKISVCNNFYQYGIPYTSTQYHTSAIDSPAFEEDLDYFSRVCRITNGLRNARIGAVGARPADFQTMRYSEKLLQGSDITVITVDMSEILGNAGRIGDDASEVARKLEAIRDYGSIPSSIPRERIVRQAKFGLALEQWIETNRIDAAAIQCWTSIQQNYGCATCLSMSMLGEQLTPCACEVDVTGVISMYALTLAQRTPSALLDWNNNYGDDRDMCVCTHCSNYPKSFISGDVEIGNLAVLGTVLGEENSFGAVKGKVAAGPMTYFRISTDDFEGEIKAYAGEGEYTDDPFDMDGGIAVCRVDDLQELLEYICKEGFEHHVAMVRGNCARALHEAADNYLGWDVYRHF
jgi:L-fucose isomerase-like protein